jgi:hypothetical protein
MAVAFDAATTDKITVTNPQTLGAGSEFTYMQWFRRTAAYTASAGTGTMKGATDIFVYYSFGGFQQYGVNVLRATTPAQSEVSASTRQILTLNTWNFVAVTYSEADGARIFSGDLATAATEPTYSTRVAGSGNTTANTSDLWINNRGAATSQTIGGDSAFAAWYDRRMDLAEIISHQWRPRVASGCKLFLLPFATGTIPDYSGNAVSCTGTGLALADQIPLGQPFG